MKKQVSWKKNNMWDGPKGGLSPGPTKGLSSPKNSRRGCLCLDGKTYSRKCCDGLLIQQGIGQTIYPREYRGAFSTAFSFDFDREVKD